jgi:long-chain acyl-CoA synthetase
VNANFADLVRATAQRYADRPALVDGDRHVTWRDLDTSVDRTARGLAASGLVPGYRVVLLMANSVEFVTSYLGCLRAGLVAVPLNTGLTAPEIAGVLADSGARLVVADADLADRIDTATARGVRVVRPDELTGEALLAERADPEALALLLYTSGTSGSPRAAMLTHRALLANVEHLTGLAERGDEAAMTSDDVVLGVLPLFHVFGLNAVLGWVCATGAGLVLARRFDPEGTLALVREHQVTRLPVAPPAIVAWLRRPELAESLASVRMVLTGASALDRGVAERFHEVTGLYVHQGYGLTEAAPAVTTTLGSGREPAPGSVGMPLPGVELRIVDEQGDDVEGDDPGEILVRGANLFSGYWPDGADGPGEDGWYATGDVGYLDGDGQLFLVDRKRELIIVSGFNVFPVEVEDVLQSAPGVREVAVIGVPNAETGEAVKAFVVPAQGETVDPAAVLEYAGTRLARFKCPAEIEVVDHLPHSVTGKVAKGRLREGAR